MKYSILYIFGATALLSACGSSNPTGTQSQPCSAVPSAVGIIPCIDGSAVSPSIDTQSLTIDTTNSGTTAAVYNPISINGHSVIPLGIEAGSTQFIYGSNPANDISTPGIIAGLNSDHDIGSNLSGVGNITLTGEFAQAEYTSAGTPSGTRVGMVTLDISETNGTMVLTGNNNFALSGETFTWDSRGHKFENQGSLLNYSGLGWIFGGDEVVGYYYGNIPGGGGSYLTGVFGASH